LDNMSWLYDYWFDERKQRPRVLITKESNSQGSEQETILVEIVRPSGPRTVGASDA